MKHFRTAAAVAALLLAFAVTGCKKADKTTAAAPTAEATPAPTIEPTPEPMILNNPLTGEEGDFNNRRPVAVSLRTLSGSSPLWGVSEADILIEGVTEGRTAGLTALYSSVDAISKVGPVAAGKDLMLQLALPLNAVPVHIDKNIYAQNLLNVLAYQDIDGLHIGTAAFNFDNDRFAAGFREENCWFTTADLLRNGMSRYDGSFEGPNTPIFSFGTRPEPESQNAAALHIAFSTSDKEVLNYDSDSKVYRKVDADGNPMVDANNNEQAAFTNVLVLYISSGIKDDGYTREYDMNRGGTGLYLTHGGWQEINWSKGDATAPLLLANTDGSTLTVNPGKTFIALWGGYYGQSLQLLDTDGNEQTIPGKPELMESGIPDDVAEAAETEYLNRQVLVELQEVQAQAKLDIGLAYDELNAIDASDPAQAELIASINARIVELQAIIDQTQAKIDAIAPNSSAPEEPTAEETPAEEAPAEQQG